ncbi:MAG: hypothetical protein C5B43_00550 [Verrucomicrobia bacterium]|nr:MAG: hypothetical protein C5B43_00550 [Verrucomicrobiota bacterium]
MTIKETNNRYRVLNFTDKHLKLQDLLGKKGLELPKEAKSELAGFIQKADSIMHINCNMDGLGLPQIAGNPETRIQLTPKAEGLSVALIVRPTEKLEMRYRPGHGKATITSQIDDAYTIITRDLKKEVRLARELIQSCTILSNENADTDEWSFDLEGSLELLTELQSKVDPGILEWPQGKKIAVTRPITLESLRIDVQKENDWFALDGEINIDQDQVWKMSKMIEALGNGKSRFIPLDDGSFLALTNELKKEIEKIARIAEKGNKVHPLRMHALMDFESESIKVKGDTHWDNFVKKVRKALSHKAEIPGLLQADLRDYQVDGFRWLSRLSQMDSGACLADDMGLGKTIQTIALILTKADKGPCLVVAPTSVCYNWVNEIKAFAPSLTSYLFSEVLGDKKEMIAKISKMEVLICSYGLLQRYTELFEKKEWEVIVLDEAQAIKNPSTQRTRATSNLKGKFKIALTGTPIENHLTELWSLFNFINPGLLGSLRSFQENFANPIQKDQCLAARKALRDLVLPFTLRRTKSQVLTDLPARTETNLIVELSKEEEVFYEAMRQKAVENLAGIDEKDAGQRKLHIFTEITKLRRACCHPSLIDPGITIASSKVNLFKELIVNLLDNHHKALVFSQYVGFLDIIRKELDQMGVSYQYLDGSTPINARKKRVEDFQGGKGDLSLISLKAGGLGLNLTAADYVFLLDPWWNPAVENQASDRAHRIGQQRPVTIYRLISKNTIEEKIIKLHKSKQDLAAEVLSGAEGSSQLTEKELLEMIGGRGA